MKLRRLSTSRPGFEAALAALTCYEAAQNVKVERVVSAIIADVRARGDAAVLEYSRRFDGGKPDAVAKLAGVRELVMVSPNPNPLVLAAAAIAGVDRVIAIGGAQAVAALAYGTRSVPRVDKIVGPGNAYVAAAKRQVFGQVGIDMIAGPSEILVIGDGSTPADWVAMDLFSQAEHDELAQALLLSPDRNYLDQVEAVIGRLIP